MRHKNAIKEGSSKIIVEKYRSGRIWYYEIIFQDFGFEIILSANQLRKIMKEDRGRIHIDFEKI